MEKVILSIEKLNGRYTVNGKRLSEMNQVEAKFLNDFFQEIKEKDTQILIEESWKKDTISIELNS